MKPCPCGAIPTTSSDITTSVVWCASCYKTLTKEYGPPEEAILVWNHGRAVLPPNCPFCHWPPELIGVDTETPQVTCSMPCPLQGRVFTLEEWNMSRPKTQRLNELVERWANKGHHVPLKALRKAIEAHVRHRFRDP
jgi:hypothetical protein